MTCKPVEKSTAFEMRPCANCCSPVSGSSTMRSTSGSLPTPAATPHQLVSSIHDLLGRRDVDDLPRTGGDRIALLEIEGSEFLPVLSLEDVLGNDMQADVVFVGKHVVEEARRRQL